MLSAVAARKAAQATRQEPAPVLSDPIKAHTSPVLSPISSPRTKPASKRKSSAQAPNPPSKSKQKVRHEKARYFAGEDVFGQQDDVIIIDQDDAEDSEDEIVAFAQDILPNPPSNPTTVVAKGKRAWSPSRPLQDSSDEEGMDVDVDTSFTPDTLVPTRTFRNAVDEPLSLLSTFEPKWDQNAFTLSSAEIQFLESSGVTDESNAMLVLTLGETLSLLGTYALTLVHGSITIAGVMLNPSLKSHHIFAPRSSPVPVIQALQYIGQQATAIHSSFPEVMHPFLKNDCAILVLQELRTGIQGLGRVCRIFDGVFQPSRWHRNDSALDLGITGAYMLTRQHRDVQPFDLPTSWDVALSAICPAVMQDQTSLNSASPSVCLIKGPKKTGKSTFARTLLNRLSTRYRKVAFLECDIGQSEFTPGGIVALNIVEQPLFGPPPTHPTIPYLAHYIGSTTPRSSPSHYLSAIQALVQSYKLDLQSPIFDIPDQEGDNRISDVIPLVVNTMGWNKGLGADLIRQIEDMVEPTHIFEVAAPVFERGWSAPPSTNDAFMRPSTSLHTLESIPASILANNYAPADHRILSILSYLHAVFPSSSSSELQQITATSWDTALPLCAHAPYEVDWTQALDKVYLTGAGAEDVASSEIECVLNGAIVGLISCEPGAIDMDVDATSSEVTNKVPYSQGSTPVSPSISTCHGIALIRAISPSSSHIHLLTPLPAELLAKCRVIMKGDLELPVWGMLDFRSEGDEAVAGVERNKVPYLQWGKGEGIGGERRRIRRNLMRKGQM